jgi:RNA methyltransferase, TrmH family
MEIITSKSNKYVKHIKSLNDKKYRQLYNEFYLEGIKVVDELLELKAVNIKFIAYSYEIVSKLNNGLELINKLKNITDYQILNIEKNIFEDLTDTINTQGIIAVVEKKQSNLNELIDSDILIIDRVQDAGNLGTIIRTAVAFNIKNIICMAGTVDVYSQKVIRSTMLSILKVNIIYVDNYDFIDQFKKEKFKIIGSCLNTNNYLKNLKNYEKIALVVGNEANGISNELLEKCDEKIKIEMTDETESLNVSIATSIIMYERFKK